MMVLSWLLLAWTLFPTSCLAGVPIGVLNSQIAKTDLPYLEIPAGQLAPILDGFKQYSLFILITTNEPKYECAMCEQFDPIYKHFIDDIFAHFGHLKNEVVFTRLEATTHMDILRKLGVKAVPAIWGFPTSLDVYGRPLLTQLEAIMHEYRTAVANGDSSYNVDAKLREYSENLEYEQLGQEHYVFDMNTGEDMNKMLSRLERFISNTIKLDIRPALGKESRNDSFDYTIIVQTFIGMFIVIQVAKKLKREETEGRPFWQEKKLYGYISIVLIYISISGLNFCMQRHSPLISQSKGEIVWIAPGSRQQMGFESILSVLFQVAFSALLVGLIDGVELFSEEDGSRDVVSLFFALALLVVLFAFMFVYGKKDASYPFALRF